MNQKNFAVTLVLLIVVAGAAFYGGMTYQKSKVANIGQFSGRNGQGMAQRGGNGVTRNGFRPIDGDIIGADSSSVTVKLTDGSSKIILINDKTAINKAETATQTDLKVGQKIAVFGIENADGSISAQNIQLNPQANIFNRPSSTTIPLK